MFVIGLVCLGLAVVVGYHCLIYAVSWWKDDLQEYYKRYSFRDWGEIPFTEQTGDFAFYWLMLFLLTVVFASFAYAILL